MPSTRTFETKSDGGETYRIFVSFPKGEPPADGYPVLYVIDGNAYFASFAETRRLLEYADKGKALVVGVGYPTDDAYDARSEEHTSELQSLMRTSYAVFC